MKTIIRPRWLCVFSIAIIPLGLLACGNSNPGSTPPGSGQGGSSPGTGAGAGGNQGGSTGTGSTQEAPVYKDGSRLHARYLDGGDGALLFSGWQDTQLGAACSFQPAGGSLRCVPDADPDVSIVYLDSACTAPAAAVTCGSTAKYVTVNDSPMNCAPGGPERAVYQIGDKVQSAQTYAMFGGACAPTGPAAPSLELHSVTQVQPSTFVAGTAKEDERGGRLSVQIVTGEDGSMQTGTIHDKQLDTDCGPHEVAASDLRCTPTLASLLTGGFFADGGCAKPLLVHMSTGDICGTPQFADGATPGDCSVLWAAVTVGKSVPAANAYQGAPGACIPAQAVPTGWSFYEKGDQVDPKSLAQLSWKQLGTGRLVARYAATTDGKDLAPPTSFYDTQKQQGCKVQRFADGKLRCVGEDIGSVDWYSDSACTVPLATASSDPCVKGPPAEVVSTSHPADPSCNSQRTIERVYEVGAKWSGAQIYSLSGTGKCTGIDPKLLGVDIYQLGKTLDTGVFPTVEEK
jgi:hypothetical protein